MSDQASISIVKAQGSIAEVERQRNEAQMHAARLAGDNAELVDLVKILKGEVDRLEAVVKRRSELIQKQDASLDGAVLDQPN